MSNCEYFRTISGTLKCVSIVLITLTLVISSLGTLTSEYVQDREKHTPVFTGKEVNLWREIYLLVAATVCLILSITNLCIHLASKDIYWNRRTGIYDFLYHACSFLLLSTSGGLNVISAVKLYEINCTSENECQQFEMKVAAGGLALLTAGICGAIAAVVLTNRKYVERDGLLADEK